MCTVMSCNDGGLHVANDMYKYAAGKRQTNVHDYGPKVSLHPSTGQPQAQRPSRGVATKGGSLSSARTLSRYTL